MIIKCNGRRDLRLVTRTIDAVRNSGSIVRTNVVIVNRWGGFDCYENSMTAFLDAYDMFNEGVYAEEFEVEVAEYVSDFEYTFTFSDIRNSYAHKSNTSSSIEDEENEESLLIEE